jgi:hypothetical protein
MSARTAPVGGRVTTNRATKARRCVVPVPTPSGIPVPCGGRRYKAYRCREHYDDWRHARETRRIPVLINPKAKPGCRVVEKKVKSRAGVEYTDYKIEPGFTPSTGPFRHAPSSSLRGARE